MAGWNMRQGNNVYELDNHARKTLFPPTQIACRICNKVFFSTQSLINHSETHMVNYETAAARRQNHELINQLAGSNVYNNFTLQTPLPPQPPNPFFVPNSQSLLNQRPIPPKNLSLLTRKNLMLGPQQRNFLGQQAVQNQQRSSSDFTKPFIDQLQEKIPDVEGVDGSNWVYESEMLDLTLKL